MYLVRELPTPTRPLVADDHYALKKIAAASRERLADARREVEAMKALGAPRGHPNCLPLLDHAVVAPGAGGGAGGGGGGAGVGGGGGSGSGSGAPVVYLLFPCYEDGTLAEEVARLAARGRRMATADVLDVFEQVRAGGVAGHGRMLCRRSWRLRLEAQEDSVRRGRCAASGALRRNTHPLRSEYA